MTEEEVLQDLQERLKGLPTEDREKLIELYEDLMAVAKENRKASIPTPVALESNAPATIRTEHDSYHNMGRILLSSMSLFFFNLIFVLGPVIAIFAIYLSLWIVSASFIVSPLFVVTQVFTGGFTSFELCLSLILCGIGIALGVGMIQVGKFLYQLVNQYINWNIRLIKGE